MLSSLMAIHYRAEPTLFRVWICEASGSIVTCPSSACGKPSEPKSSQQRPHSVLDLWPSLHVFWPVSSVPLVHGIYQKQISTGGFLKIKCWLSWTANLPPVCSWQQEVLSKHHGLHKRGGIFMLSLEDTTYAIITPRTQHPFAGWWIPLIKDLLVWNSVQHALLQCLLYYWPNHSPPLHAWNLTSHCCLSHNKMLTFTDELKEEF